MTIPNLLTVTQFVQKYPAFTIGGMRYFIFNENSNGLAESKAIVRFGRKLLIDEDKFFNFITQEKP